MALHFQYVSLASPPANLLAAPAVAPIMWLGMLASVAAQVAPAAALPFNVLNGFLLAYVEWVAHAAAAAPAAAIPIHLNGPSALAAANAIPIACALALRAWWRRRGAAVVRRLLPGLSRGERRRRWIAPAAAGGSALLAGLTPLLASAGDARGAGPRAPGELVVSFLDIGQGDATLLQRDGAAILVHIGPAERSDPPAG